MKLQIIQSGRKFLIRDKDTGSYLGLEQNWFSEIPSTLPTYVFCESIEHCHIRIGNLIKEREHKMSAHEQTILKEVEI